MVPFSTHHQSICSSLNHHRLLSLRTAARFGSSLLLVGVRRRSQAAMLTIFISAYCSSVRFITPSRWCSQAFAGSDAHDATPLGNIQYLCIVSRCDLSVPFSLNVSACPPFVDGVRSTDYFSIPLGIVSRNSICSAAWSVDRIRGISLDGGDLSSQRVCVSQCAPR